MRIPYELEIDTHNVLELGLRPKMTRYEGLDGTYLGRID
jgi:hypothetical protein